ncbi:transketolase, partial [Patescibacteria group bacterium]|nr:transketolase [Patescibacteria group bacterium]
MRKTFVKTLEELFDQDPKVVLFLGDIGAFLLRNIKQKHPRRFINVGISEAAMMSAAAGMALDGWKPFVYTITPFVTARCFDQIRVGVGYHHANVKIVGVGSGISYSPLGATHHSFEDTSIMRTIPGITILAPDSPSGTAKAVWQAAKIQGPVYLRLTLNLSDENRPGKSKKFKAMEVIKHGSRVILVSYGETVKECVLAAEKLEAKGIYPTVISINLIKPLSKKLISIISSSSADYIFSVEEHGIIGGLG